MKNDEIMKKQTMAAIVLGVLSLFAMALWALKDKANTSPYFIDPQNQELVVQGKAVYATHCAACHGINLEGQLNWRKRLPNGRLPAPPHDENGHTWHHPDTQLFDIVQNGLVPGKTAPDGYASDMPAYRNILSDHDIISVLAYIKSRWPAEALKAQKDVTFGSR